MPEIKFKATRKKHSSGYAEIEKSGNLEYDGCRYDKDIIHLFLSGKRGAIVIDCDYKTKVFSVKFNQEDFERE